jgi:hypothetical protein
MDGVMEREPQNRTGTRRIRDSASRDFATQWRNEVFGEGCREVRHFDIADWAVIAARFELVSRLGHYLSSPLPTELAYTHCMIGLQVRLQNSTANEP